MKIKNIRNVDKFLQVVSKCEGQVELVTGDGSRFNLKSTLSQYLSLSNLFQPDGSVKAELPELNLVVHEKKDMDRLIDFMFEERKG